MVPGGLFRTVAERKRQTRYDPITMSILDFFSNLFGGGDPYGGHDPNDLEMFWRIEHELDQAERGAQTTEQALQKLNLKSVAQAERVKGAYGQRHMGDPAFQQAAIEFQTRVQLGNMRQH